MQYIVIALAKHTAASSSSSCDFVSGLCSNFFFLHVCVVFYVSVFYQTNFLLRTIKMPPVHLEGQ